MLCLSGLNTFTVSGVIMRPANWLLEGGGGGGGFLEPSALFVYTCKMF